MFLQKWVSTLGISFLCVMIDALMSLNAFRGSFSFLLLPSHSPTSLPIISTFFDNHFLCLSCILNCIIDRLLSSYVFFRLINYSIKNICSLLAVALMSLYFISPLYKLLIFPLFQVPALEHVAWPIFDDDVLAWLHSIGFKHLRIPYNNHALQSQYSEESFISSIAR